MQTIRLIVKGKVQGVFFRAFVKGNAEQLGITGWVKNLPDKNVEIKASSSEEKIKEFIDLCRQGPPRAVVEDIITEDMPNEQFNGFKIIR
jgi:acylphosphatase